MLLGEIDYFGQLQSILFNMLPFYCFYYFSRKGVLTKNHIICVLFLLPVFIFKFNESVTETLNSIRNNYNVVENTIYMF